jgi:predicted hydrocarbon binding protein
VVRITNSPVSQIIKSSGAKIGCPVDGLARGMYAGSANVIFKCDMDAVETRCVAMGDPYCEFVLKPRDEWKKEKSPALKSQLFPEVR